MKRKALVAIGAMFVVAAPAQAAVLAGPITNPPAGLLGQREVRSTITSTAAGLVTVKITRSAYRHPAVTTIIPMTFLAAGDKVAKVTCKPQPLPFAWVVTATHEDGSTSSSYATLRCM